MTTAVAKCSTRSVGLIVSPAGSPLRISADPGFCWVCRRVVPRIGHTRATRRCAQQEAGPSRYVADFRRGTLALLVRVDGLDADAQPVDQCADDAARAGEHQRTEVGAAAERQEQADRDRADDVPQL